jgi:multicomponent Na+:H+ antiporter subunit E
MGYALQFMASYLAWVLLVWPFRTGAAWELLLKSFRAGIPAGTHELLTGLPAVMVSGGWQELLAGLPVALFCAVAFGKLFPRNVGKVRNPLRWLFAAAWLAALGWDLVLGGLDAAWQTLFPRESARPAIVRVRTAVRSDAGRFALALSLSVAPGMVLLDIVGQDLYIYWADALTESPSLRAELTVGRVEELVRRVFD